MTTDVPRSVGRKRSDRFGGNSPPVVYRLWSSCVHPVLSCYGCSAKELSGRPARAIVNPRTDLAPASRSAREHASSVAPVVITSSSSRIRKLSTGPPSRMAKAPRTASHLSSLLSRCFSGRGFARTSNSGRYGKRHRFASGRPTRSTWLYPRSRLLCRCSGTGTITSAAMRSPCACISSASRFANHWPSGSISSCFNKTTARERVPS